MELIDVKQRVGKSVLIATLKKSGAEVIAVTNGYQFLEADLICAENDLANVMGNLYPLLELKIRELQDGMLDHPIDYLCFHIRNDTPEFYIPKLKKVVMKYFDFLPWSPKYLMVLHA